jgi:hypothetical protein
MLRLSFLLAFTLNPATGTSDNPLLRDLVDQGVSLPGHGPVKLPAPLMAPGQSAAQELAILKKAADRYPFAQFIRKTDVAPYVLKINPIEGRDKERVGQAIDLWFVAHGKLKKAVDKELLERFLGSSRKPGEDAGELIAEQLKKRGIVPLAGKNLEERYAFVRLDLLDKVEMSGVGRSVKTETARIVQSAMVLDTRFAKDPDYPNQWRAVTKPGGVRKLGPPRPYAGMGGYIQLTELQEPAGAMFVEFHLVLSEPHDWFDGRNLFKAKLPLAMQDRVRSFRRALLR